MSTLGNDIKRLGFPQGKRKRCLENSCYELNTYTETLTITSKGEIRSFYRKDKAPQLIETWGEEKARRFGILFAYLFVTTFFILILVYAFRDLFEFLENAFWFFVLAAVGAIIYFGSLSRQYTDAVTYYKSSRCKKCNRDFALEEFKDPLITEVSTPDKYKIARTKYWKCKFCGTEDYRTEELDYNNHKGKKSKQKEDTCRICKKKFAMSEYRDPDVKKVGNVETTVRHYKCLNCGFQEITIEKAIIEEMNIQ